MGGCCCCASASTELHRSTPFFHYPVSELPPHHTTADALSTGLLVDTNLDTSLLDTYQPPPAPIPYETYAGRPQTPNREGSGYSNNEALLETTNVESIEAANAESTFEIKAKNLESDEKSEINSKLETSKEMEDESSDDELKKSSKSVVPPLQDEDDICPTCLEEYDAENPKIITKCDHHFHLGCILEWMERSDTCAVCDQLMVISPVGGV